MESIELKQGTIEYVDAGRGPALVFVHGVLVDHRIWSGVVARLSDRFRCIAPNLPVGAHRLPMRAGADLSLHGQAQLLIDFIDALGLEDVTLIGNDTGGAVCQLVVSRAPSRVTRLVLTNCDAFEVFPPAGFGYLLWAPRIPGLMRLSFAAMRSSAMLRRLPFAYGALTHRRLDDALLASWVEPGATSRGVRRDLHGLLRGAGPQITLEVAERLHRFDGASLLLWSKDDRFFPLSLAQRLAGKLKHARLEVLEGGGLLVALDLPDEVAAHVARFHRETDGRSPAASTS